MASNGFATPRDPRTLNAGPQVIAATRCTTHREYKNSKQIARERVHPRLVASRGAFNAARILAFLPRQLIKPDKTKKRKMHAISE